MTTWQPLDRLPDPLRIALRDAVRAFLLQYDVGRGIQREADGSLSVPMSDGGHVRVSLRSVSQRMTSFGVRQAIRYDLEGRAVTGRRSFGLAASATLDVRSRAFSDIDCHLTWQEPV